MMSDVSVAAADALRRAGLRATGQRIALLGYLMQAGEPVSVDGIARALRGALNPVTAYRSLGQMRDAGLIRVLSLGGAVRYEYAARHHHHLVCRGCGRVEDIGICVPSLSRRAVARAGFSSVEDHSLEFFGTCAACA